MTTYTRYEKTFLWLMLGLDSGIWYQYTHSTWSVVSVVLAIIAASLHATYAFHEGPTT